MFGDVTEPFTPLMPHDTVDAVVAEVLRLRVQQAMDEGPIDVDTTDTEAEGDPKREAGEHRDPDFYAEALAAADRMAPVPPAKRKTPAPKKGGKKASPKKGSKRGKPKQARQQAATAQRKATAPKQASSKAVHAKGGKSSSSPAAQEETPQDSAVTKRGRLVKDVEKWNNDRAFDLAKLPPACLPQHPRHGHSSWALKSASNAAKVDVLLDKKAFYLKMNADGVVVKNACHNPWGGCVQAAWGTAKARVGFVE